MKRILSVALLFLIVFNTIGYYAVLMVMQSNQGVAFEHKLDEFASEINGQLMLVLPLNNYAPDSEGYERVEGEIVYEGKVYHKVKQKIYHDNLYLICVTDAKGTAIHDAIADVSKTFTGSQPEKADGPIKIILSAGKCYLISDHLTPANLIGLPVPHLNSNPSTGHSFDGKDSVFHPPQLG